MRIIVCIKQTPDTEAQVRISENGKALLLQEAKNILNPYDEFAIEEALRIKEKTGGDVLLACFGPESAKEQLLRGLAMGADRGILISSAPFPHITSLLTATILARLVEGEQGDLVLCGKQGIDEDNMQVGVMLAELLTWPHVNAVTQLALTGTTAHVEREAEGGQTEVYRVELPAVFGAHKSLNTPRYASLPGIMKAKKKPLDTKTISDLGLEEAHLQSLVQTVVVNYEYPPKKPEGKMFKGSSTESMVTEVLELLRTEAKII
jgi:electron transfer flavoprotein beta subunit